MADELPRWATRNGRLLGRWIVPEPDALSDWPVARDQLGYSPEEFLSLLLGADTPEAVAEARDMQSGELLALGADTAPADGELLPATSGPPAAKAIPSSDQPQDPRLLQWPDISDLRFPPGTIVEEAYRALDFDPMGPGQIAVALQHPEEALQGLLHAAHARLPEWFEWAREDDLPYAPESGDADAVKHTQWSHEMQWPAGGGTWHLKQGWAPTFAIAKALGDAHEVSTVNKVGTRLMDLVNNEVGRRLAAMPAKGLSSREIALRAHSAGLLRTQPYNVIDGVIQGE